MLDIKTLETWLWDAACSIRGAVDAPKFKDYILPLIFIKRLSDVFEDEIKKLSEEFGDEKTALEIVSKDHSLVRFYIPKKATWPEIRKQTTKIGEKLTDAVRAIAKENQKLQGVIDIVDFNATVSGQRIIDDGKLSSLIEIISRHRLGLKDAEPDILGRAYEYLLRKFAEGQGQSAGEFYTPKEVGWIMAYILNPEQGQGVYDPACGSGGLLIKSQLALKEKAKKISKPLQLYGQEQNHVTYAMAKMNMFIHDMEGDIAIGDTLRNPKFLKGSSLRTFDLVVANPMWNQDGYAEEFYEADTFNRFEYGYAPASSADWGWVQLMFASLNDDGKAAIVLDAAAVTRGSLQASNKEKEIRKKFIENDYIEAVLLLPENIFYNTPAQGIIIVLNKDKKRKGKILLINASQEFVKETPKNIISEEAIKKIPSVYHKWSNVKHFSTVISIKDAANEDYNLNPAKYISNGEQKGLKDIDEIMVELSELEEAKKDEEIKLTKIIDSVKRLVGGFQDSKTSKVDEGKLPKNWKTIKLGEIIEFNLGRTPPRKEKSYWELGKYHWVSISDMKDNPIIYDTAEKVSEKAFEKIFKKKIVPKGTLLMSFKLTIGRTAILGVDAFHNEAIISIYPKPNVDNGFLFYYLPTIDYTLYQDKAIKGQTLNKEKIKKILIPLPPLDEQIKISKILQVLGSLYNLTDNKKELLSELSKTLVYRLTKGVISVKDLDIEVN
jgi:type I restriction enzyme M protein